MNLYAEIVLIALISFIVVMTISYIVCFFMKDNSIIDMFWGSGFIVVLTILVIFYRDELFNSDSISWFFMSAYSMVIMWGTRLTAHIIARKEWGKEDFRYKKWRDNWKWFNIRSYFNVFLFQAIVGFIILLPLYFILGYSIENTSTDLYLIILSAFGLFISWSGIIIESTADYHLTKFLKRPNKETDKNKICKRGLWKYSRHPNYLGEQMMWWGMGFTSCLTVIGIAGLLGPLSLTLTFIIISTPLLEKKSQEQFGKEWDIYKTEAHKFFPKFSGKKVSKDEDKELKK